MNHNVGITLTCDPVEGQLIVVGGHQRGNISDVMQDREWLLHRLLYEVVYGLWNIINSIGLGSLTVKIMSLVAEFLKCSFSQQLCIVTAAVDAKLSFFSLMALVSISFQQVVFFCTTAAATTATTDQMSFLSPSQQCQSTEGNTMQ